MITLNGINYKLCLVDTNIVSEMVKHPSREFRTFTKLTLSDKYIPCFSMFTVLELRQRMDVYEQFLNLFSIYPCIITKSHGQLFLEELDRYPSPSTINPILVASPGLGEDNNLKNILGLVFDTPENLKMEAEWNAGKNTVIEGILSLKDNFPAKTGKYSKKEIRKFIEWVGFEQIARQANDFANRVIQSGNMVSIDAFPSLKMILFTVFYKFYVDNRNPSLSDTFDIIISAPTFYMDAVFTEKHQAEVIRKIKMCDKFLDHLKIFRLKDLRT